MAVTTQAAMEEMTTSFFPMSSSTMVDEMDFTTPAPIADSSDPSQWSQAICSVNLTSGVFVWIICTLLSLIRVYQLYRDRHKVFQPSVRMLTITHSLIFVGCWIYATGVLVNASNCHQRVEQTQNGCRTLISFEVFGFILARSAMYWFILDRTNVFLEAVFYSENAVQIRWIESSGKGLISTMVISAAITYFAVDVGEVFKRKKFLCVNSTPRYLITFIVLIDVILSVYCAVLFSYAVSTSYRLKWGIIDAYRKKSGRNSRMQKAVRRIFEARDLNDDNLPSRIKTNVSLKRLNSQSNAPKSPMLLSKGSKSNNNVQTMAGFATPVLGGASPVSGQAPSNFPDLLNATPRSAHTPQGLLPGLDFRSGSDTENEEQQQQQDDQDDVPLLYKVEEDHTMEKKKEKKRKKKRKVRRKRLVRKKKKDKSNKTKKPITPSAKVMADESSSKQEIKPVPHQPKPSAGKDESETAPLIVVQSPTEKSTDSSVDRASEAQRMLTEERSASVLEVLEDEWEAASDAGDEETGAVGASSVDGAAKRSEKSGSDSIPDRSTHIKAEESGLDSWWARAATSESQAAKQADEFADATHRSGETTTILTEERIEAAKKTQLGVDEEDLLGDRAHSLMNSDLLDSLADDIAADIAEAEAEDEAEPTHRSLDTTVIREDGDGAGPSGPSMRAPEGNLLTGAETGGASGEDGIALEMQSLTNKRRSMSDNKGGNSSGSSSESEFVDNGLSLSMDDMDLKVDVDEEEVESNGLDRLSVVANQNDQKQDMDEEPKEKKATLEELIAMRGKIQWTDPKLRERQIRSAYEDDTDFMTVLFESKNVKLNEEQMYLQKIRLVSMIKIFCLTILMLLMAFMIIWVLVLFVSPFEVLIWMLGATVVIFFFLVKQNWGYIPSCICICGDLRDDLLMMQEALIHDRESPDRLEAGIQAFSEWFYLNVCTDWSKDKCIYCWSYPYLYATGKIDKDDKIDRKKRGDHEFSESHSITMDDDDLERQAQFKRKQDRAGLDFGGGMSAYTGETAHYEAPIVEVDWERYTGKPTWQTVQQQTEKVLRKRQRMLRKLRRERAKAKGVDVEQMEAARAEQRRLEALEAAENDEKKSEEDGQETGKDSNHNNTNGEGEKTGLSAAASSSSKNKSTLPLAAAASSSAAGGSGSLKKKKKVPNFEQLASYGLSDGPTAEEDAKAEEESSSVELRNWRGQKIENIQWFECAYDEDLWDEHLQDVADTVKKMNKKGRARLWKFFDPMQIGMMEMDTTFTRLIYSCMVCYVKKEKREADPPMYWEMKSLIESIVEEMKFYITSSEDQERIGREEFLKKIGDLFQQGIDARAQVKVLMQKGHKKLKAGHTDGRIEMSAEETLNKSVSKSGIAGAAGEDTTEEGAGLKSQTGGAKVVEVDEDDEDEEDDPLYAQGDDVVSTDASGAAVLRTSVWEEDEDDDAGQPVKTAEKFGE